MDRLLPALELALGILLFALLIGLAANWRRMRRRVQWEDALKHICSAKHDGRVLSFAELASRLRISDRAARNLVEALDVAGLVRSDAKGFTPTQAGENIGFHMLRGHRLWERYLTDEARIPLDRVHDQAERAEHSFQTADLDSLADHLGHPRSDPHGDLIPSAGGAVRPRGHTPLTSWPLDLVGVIDHIEDEPPQALREIVRAGLRPGTVMRVVAQTDEAVLCETAAGSCTLTPQVAAMIDMRPAAEGEVLGKRPTTLADLPLGESAEVATLVDNCTGLGRRRLLDLGFTAGAPVKAILANVQDEAHAYRIRDTMIALRKEQAEQVLIRPLEIREFPGPVNRG